MGLNLPLQGKKESLMPPTENIFIPALPETAVAEAVLQHLVFIHRPFLPLNVLP